MHFIRYSMPLQFKRLNYFIGQFELQLYYRYIKLCVHHKGVYCMAKRA